MQLNWLESCKLKSGGCGGVKSDVEFLGTDPSHYKSGLGFVLTSQSSLPNVSLKSTQPWSSEPNESSVLGFCCVGQFFSLGLVSSSPLLSWARNRKTQSGTCWGILALRWQDKMERKTLLSVFWIQRQEESWVYAESSFSERVWSSAEKKKRVVEGR